MAPYGVNLPIGTLGAEGYLQDITLKDLYTPLGSYNHTYTIDELLQASSGAVMSSTAKDFPLKDSVGSSQAESSVVSVTPFPFVVNRDGAGNLLLQNPYDQRYVVVGVRPAPTDPSVITPTQTQPQDSLYRTIRIRLLDGGETQTPQEPPQEPPQQPVFVLQTPQQPTQSDYTTFTLQAPQQTPQHPILTLQTPQQPEQPNYTTIRLHAPQQTPQQTPQQDVTLNTQLFYTPGKQNNPLHPSGPSQHPSGPSQHSLGPSQHPSGPLQHSLGPSQHLVHSQHPSGHSQHPSGPSQHSHTPPPRPPPAHPPHRSLTPTQSMSFVPVPSSFPAASLGNPQLAHKRFATHLNPSESSGGVQKNGELKTSFAVIHEGSPQFTQDVAVPEQGGISYAVPSDFTGPVSGVVGSQGEESYSGVIGEDTKGGERGGGKGIGFRGVLRGIRGQVNKGLHNIRGQVSKGLQGLLQQGGIKDLRDKLQEGELSSLVSSSVKKVSNKLNRLVGPWQNQMETSFTSTMDDLRGFYDTVLPGDYFDKVLTVLAIIAFIAFVHVRVSLMVSSLSQSSVTVGLLRHVQDLLGAWREDERFSGVFEFAASVHEAVEGWTQAQLDTSASVPSKSLFDSLTSFFSLRGEEAAGDKDSGGSGGSTDNTNFFDKMFFKKALFLEAEHENSASPNATTTNTTAFSNPSSFHYSALHAPTEVSYASGNTTGALVREVEGLARLGVSLVNAALHLSPHVWSPSGASCLQRPLCDLNERSDQMGGLAAFIFPIASTAVSWLVRPPKDSLDLLETLRPLWLSGTQHLGEGCRRIHTCPAPHT
ncbi:uncharacterized protein LOC135092065 [Scylla paramamosain]|uniref:uncharacterized protein LOC135092065 n=1 Tax=Scylla paramamosain TaxID=85552 RepID=UPI003082971F